MSLTTKMMLRRMGGRRMAVFVSMLIIAWAMAMMVSGLLGAETMEASASSFLKDNGMPDAFISLSENRPEQQVSGLLNTTDIGTYQMRLKAGGVLIGAEGNRSVLLIGVNDPGRPDINRLQLIDGRMFSSPDEGVVVSGAQNVGNEADLVVNGSSLHLMITGTVRSPEYLLNDLQTGALVPGSGGALVIIMPIQTLQTVAGDGINDILIIMNGNGTVDAVIHDLHSLPISSYTLRQDHPTAVFIQMGVNKLAVMLPVISLVFALIGAVSILVTMYRMVQSDSRSIGLLMSLGIGRMRILSGYLAVGSVIILIGGLLGAVMGYGFTSTIMTVALAMLGDIPVVLSFDPAPYLVGLLMTAAIVVVAILVPVGMVLHKNVREALSYVPKNRVWVRRGKGRSVVLSMGARNLLREPKRALVIIGVVALAIAAAGSWMVLLDSNSTYINGQISSYDWDVRVGFNMPVVTADAVSNYSTGHTVEVIPYNTFNGLAVLDGRTSGVVVIASPDMARARTFDLRSDL